MYIFILIIYIPFFTQLHIKIANGLGSGKVKSAFSLSMAIKSECSFWQEEQGAKSLLLFLL